MVTGWAVTGPVPQLKLALYIPIVIRRLTDCKCKLTYYRREIFTFAGNSFVVQILVSFCRWDQACSTVELGLTAASSVAYGKSWLLRKNPTSRLQEGGSMAGEEMKSKPEDVRWPAGLRLPIMLTFELQV